MRVLEYESQRAQDEKKYRLQLIKQNKLMHVCLCVLLNLAEEISIEKKMAWSTRLIVKTDQIAVPETLSNLVRLAQHQNQRIALLSLRLLFNLSFDERVRAALVESGIVKLLVDLLKNPPFRHIVLRLLYHFSMDDRCKSLMAYHRD
eukprot:g15878.t1